MEQDLRKQAIERYLKGESPKNIYSDLDRSKNWFFKWLKRYQSGEPNWYKDRSRAPVNRPKAITASDRKRIIKTRIHLESQKYAQTGPSAIKWELTKAGHRMPSDSTIKRVLKQEGLIKKNALRPQRGRVSVFYGSVRHQPHSPGRSCRPSLHKGRWQVLFIQRHRSLQPSGLCRGPAYQSRSASRWKSAALLEGRGLPDFLLLDNELSFRGSNRYPRSLGLVIRLCLHFGVTPVFIPVSEPWRNGVIESFNDTYNKKFFRRQWFKSYAQLKRQCKNFQTFHNNHHRYSCLKGKTPMAVVAKAQLPILKLGANTKIPIREDIPDGNIILIRFIRSNRILSIFGEQFTVSKDLVYSYVKAVIVTEIHTLQLYLGEELVTSFDYKLRD